jgi:mono/diheme cytochrome c family protein
MIKTAALLALFIATVGFCGLACAQEQASSADASTPIHGRTAASAATKTSPAPTSTTSASKSAPAVIIDDRAARIEGEKRFQTHCGRCHMAPHKFPPRTMATVIRHMRVRAMITDEDMRLILRYMTQ